MRPLRSAMNLIDAHHGNFAPILGQIFGEEAFRRDEKHFNLFVFNGGKDGLLSRETLLRVDAGTGHVVGQFAQLVSHQRDQGSDNQD